MKTGKKQKPKTGGASDEKKTKMELIDELVKLRRKSARMEKIEAGHKAAMDKLRESEARLRGVFESRMVGILFWDANGDITDANDEFLEMVGYTRDEVLSGKVRWRDMTPVEYAHLDDKALKEVADRGACTPFKKEYIRKDGSRIPILLGAALLPGPTFSGVAYIIVITERKQAEEELASSEEFLNSVIEQSPVSLWISDSEGTLIKMNQSCRELFGATDEEAVGKYNLFKDNLIEEQGFIPLVENVFEKGEIARFTIDYDLPRVEHVKVNGATHRILDVVISPIKDMHGKVTNAIVQHKDITERKMAEDRIEHLNLVLKAIRNVNQLITQENDRDRLLKGACESLVETRGFNHVWIALLDDRGRLETAVEGGLGEGLELLNQSMEQGKLPGCARRAMQQAEVVIINDPAVDCKDCPLHGIYGDTGSMSIRLQHEGRVHGVMTVSILRDRIDDEDERSLFEELAGDIAFALSRLESEAAKKEAVEALKESEDKYRTLVENLPQKIFHKDRNSVYVSVSENFARDLGIEPDEAKGKTDFNFFPKELAEKYRADDRRIVETGAMEELEEKYIHEGREVWVHTVKTPVKDENGRITGVLGIFWDISDRRQAQEELTKSQRELSIRNRIAEIFLAVSDDEVRYNDVLLLILEVTESRYGIFGYIDEDGAFVCPSMTKDIWDKCKMPDKEIVFPRETWGDSIWARSIREKETLYSNEPFNVPEGHISINRALMVPIIHDGEVIGLIELANKNTDYGEKDIKRVEAIADYMAPILNVKLQRDRHERARKRAEDELNQTLVELKRSNKELEQFAYVASHDLQEPLRMVSSYVQLLERRYKEKLDDDAKDFIGFAVDGADRMKQLVDDLLVFSRVGTMGKELTPVDSTKIAKDAVANLKAAIDEAGAKVTVETLPPVMADETQFVQLFQNLVANALKFRGKQAPEIRISAEIKGGDCEFCVSDNGIGIEPKFSDRIFVIFQRLHGRTEYKGTGIGLAVSKKIVERHGGKIWVESEPGKGSTFFFTIPLKGGKES